MQRKDESKYLLLNSKTVEFRPQTQILFRSCNSQVSINDATSTNIMKLQYKKDNMCNITGFVVLNVRCLYKLQEWG